MNGLTPRRFVTGGQSDRTNIRNSNHQPPLMTPFVNGHAEGSLMILNAIPGNPGPQPNYNPLQDTAVVRYYSVIN